MGINTCEEDVNFASKGSAGLACKSIRKMCKRSILIVFIRLEVRIGNRAASHAVGGRFRFLEACFDFVFARQLGSWAVAY